MTTIDHTGRARKTAENASRALAHRARIARTRSDRECDPALEGVRQEEELDRPVGVTAGLGWLSLGNVLASGDWALTGGEASKRARAAFIVTVRADGTTALA